MGNTRLSRLIGLLLAGLCLLGVPALAAAGMIDLGGLTGSDCPAPLVTLTTTARLWVCPTTPPPVL